MLSSFYLFYFFDFDLFLDFVAILINSFGNKAEYKLSCYINRFRHLDGDSLCTRMSKKGYISIICNITYNVEKPQSRRIMEDWAQGMYPTSHFGFHRLVNLKRTHSKTLQHFKIL